MTYVGFWTHIEISYRILYYRIVSCCDRRRQRVTGISGAPCAISSTLTMSCSAQHPCFIIIPHSSHSHSFASPNLSPCVLTMHPPKWSSFTFCRIPNSSHFFLLHHYPPFFYIHLHLHLQLIPILASFASPKLSSSTFYRISSSSHFYLIAISIGGLVPKVLNSTALESIYPRSRSGSWDFSDKVLVSSFFWKRP